MMRFLKNLFGICLLLAFIMACSGVPLTVPTPAPHKPTGAVLGSVATPPDPTATSPLPRATSVLPTAAIENSPFDQSSCPVDDSGRNVCPSDSPLGQLGCEWIAAPDEALSDLEPPYPINICWLRGYGGQFLTSEEYIYRTGCMLPQYARYVVQRQGQFVLLGSLPELQEAYAPISSEQEALSYALAATGLQAFVDFEAPPNYRYFVESVKDSQAILTDQGYLVNLYDYQLCGCGPHTTFAVEVLIKVNGSVEETSRTPAFEDPEQDSLCID